MNLRGSVAKLQKFRAGFYLKIAERFNGNALIRDTWTLMAHDLEQQEASLRALPIQFWARLDTEEKALLEVVSDSLKVRDRASVGTMSLQSCFGRTLDLEEPLTLRIYAPLIRYLRADWSDRSLDLYVVIKAHLARLTRTIGPFSGDPALVERSVDLLEKFEQQVQQPAARLKPTMRSAARKIPVVRPRTARASHRSLPSRLKQRGLTKRAKGVRKPLVKNLKIARRRIRR